jgi:hypothetical protein
MKSPLTSMTSRGPTKRILLDVDADLHKQFKALCVELGLPMCTVLHELINGHLALYEHVSRKRRAS